MKKPIYRFLFTDSSRSAVRYPNSQVLFSDEHITFLFTELMHLQRPRRNHLRPTLTNCIVVCILCRSQNKIQFRTCIADYRAVRDMLGCMDPTQGLGLTRSVAVMSSTRKHRTTHGDRHALNPLLMLLYRSELKHKNEGQCHLHDS